MDICLLAALSHEKLVIFIKVFFKEYINLNQEIKVKTNILTA
jgi:hypothetical protein